MKLQFLGGTGNTAPARQTPVSTPCVATASSSLLPSLFFSPLSVSVRIRVRDWSLGCVGSQVFKHISDTKVCCTGCFRTTPPFFNFRHLDSVQQCGQKFHTRTAPAGQAIAACSWLGPVPLLWFSCIGTGRHVSVYLFSFAPRCSNPEV